MANEIKLDIVTAFKALKHVVHRKSARSAVERIIRLVVISTVELWDFATNSITALKLLNSRYERGKPIETLTMKNVEKLY